MQGPFVFPWHNVKGIDDDKDAKNEDIRAILTDKQGS